MRLLDLFAVSLILYVPSSDTVYVESGDTSRYLNSRYTSGTYIRKRLYLGAHHENREEDHQSENAGLVLGVDAHSWRAPEVGSVHYQPNQIQDDADGGQPAAHFYVSRVEIVEKEDRKDCHLDQ